MKITKHARYLSILLALLMVFSTAAVFADETETSADSNATETTTDATEEAVTEDAADDASEEATLTATAAEAGVTVVPSSTSVKVGNTVALTATVSDSTGEPVSDATVNWSSDATSIATVSDGTVTGVKAGSATITAKATVSGTEYTGTCDVTVTEDAFTTVAPTITMKKKYDSGDYEGKYDNGYTIKWSHSDATGVDAYQVLRWKKGASSKSVIKTVKVGGTYSLFVLVPSGTYYYSVKAIQYKDDGKTIANSKESSSKTATISKVLTSTAGMDWYCIAKRKAVIYKKGSGSAKKTTVKKGTKMYAIGRYPSKVKKYHYAQRVKVTYKVKSGGKTKTVTGWIKWSDLKGGVKGNIIKKKDYSRSLKEYFVNAGWNKKHYGKSTPITSKDNVLVWVSLHTQRAYIFNKQSNGQWKLARTEHVTTGKYSQPTRSSEKAGNKIFTIRKKVKGKVWMVQENGKRYYFTTVSYVSASGVSFHTGTWWANGKTRVVVSTKGKLGTYGCIRMSNGSNGGAAYIYNKTKVKKSAVLITLYD